MRASEGESMTGLRTKLGEIKTVARTLQEQINRHDTESSIMNAEIKRLEMELERKVNMAQEKQKKLQKFNDVLQASQNALKKLTETATKLDEIIAIELTTIKPVLT